ncbi:MAG: GNAT family N-acetyltransferase, partial [Pseudomonadota bacterium]|nr:GNAT family N-acetyltransferase [Pseudomonadota bacterium]
IICRNEEGFLIAAVPLYLKGHSYGEYIFDWSWADAWERSGNRYFPKLLSGVPFTPVTCRKLLVKQGEDLISMQQALVQALVSVTKQLDVSSLHVNFIPPEEIKPFETTDFLNRSGLQYHWLNKNYESFDDFLSELTSRKRKSIKKERKNALQNGIKISALNGNDIKSFHWDAFYNFYLDTTEKKWGGAYLNKAFFELIGERMSDKILLIFAEYNGQPVGGALNFIGKTTLFGRNWGCTADFKFLHFEACYYQAIDFAISNKIVSVEAGAQGHHKLQRGYLPTLTHSTHFISDIRFRAAVEGFLKKETQQILFEKQELDKMSPFKK